MSGKKFREEITAYGHPNVTSTHTTTFEFTKATEIKKIADCIIAVKANKACGDLNEIFKKELIRGKEIEIIINAEGVVDKIIACGSPSLKLTDFEDIVVRKSDFIDGRTMAINANKAACDLKKELIEKLRDSNTKIKITLRVKSR